MSKRKSIKITLADVLSLNPCWLHDGRASELRQRLAKPLTPTQIAEASDVSPGDRRWVLTRLLAARDHLALVRWAAGCALDVAHLAGEDEDVALAAVAAAVEWAEGCGSTDRCRTAAYTADATYSASAWSAAASASEAACAAYYATAAAAYAAAHAARYNPHLEQQHLLNLAAELEAL